MLNILYLLFFSSTLLSTELSFKESIKEKFEKADYLSLVSVTNNFDSELNQDGYISYFRGSSLLELNQFDEASKLLIDAMTKKNREKDLFYKLGQSYFALENFKQSRVYFKKSIQREFKRAVSLYYIAFSSAKLNDFKTAVRIYSTIEKLPKKEKKDVIQAARLQIADIYYQQVKKRNNFFDAIKSYVLPQYEKALSWDKKSNLAQQIRNKIRSIEQKYEIVLYKMRNGRRTSIPRFFLKGGIFSGYDSNVNSLTSEGINALDDESVSSVFVGSSLFGRYSFYPNSKFSFSPEMTLSYKNYISSIDSINSNDEVSLDVGTFFTYEHFLFKNAATSSLMLDYNLRASDSEVDSTFSQLEKYFTITLSEEFQFYKNNTTIFRFINSTLTSEFETLNYSRNSMVLEQLITGKSLIYYLFFSYDRLRFVESDTEDINRFTLRSDFIFNSFFNIINIAPYVSYTVSDYINDVDDKSTNLIQLGVNLNRPVIKKVYINTDLSYEKQSNDEESDYSALKLLVSIDYVY